MDYLYNIAVETDTESILIDWNTSVGWIEKYREQLNNANSIALIPIEGSGLPVIITKLGNNKRWIIFTRNFGAFGNDNQVKLYCIGWQRTVDDKNEKQLVWIYPTGAVEISEEPTMWRLFI